MARMLQRLSIIVVLVAVHGCSCLDDPGTGGMGGGSGAGPGGGSGGAGAFDPELKAYAAAQGERCLVTFITNSGLDPLSPASLAQARTAYAAGESDIPLSPTGCTRMLVTRDA